MPVQWFSLDDWLLRTLPPPPRGDDDDERYAGVCCIRHHDADVQRLFQEREGKWRSVWESYIC
ncbi:hypothetical protein OUZ56_009339 [Daphnia magna]|uniref:Uncharacterized protein n=1 Tax=Daphnia magna TaxID=35525 RepID=A0ABR0AFP4_9CRUS|nr:hypothetical protein OUZ56_009339 [Daphnia magna]